MTNAILNLALCVPAILICILQVASEASRKWIKVWAAYTALLVISIFNGFQTLLLGTFPKPPNIATSAAIMAILFVIYWRSKHAYK